MFFFTPSLSRKAGLKMFAAGVLIGLLVLSPFEAAETEGNVNKTRSRQPRHWGNLFHMTAAATGRNPQDFVFYGRYCGFGNAGETLKPLDKIDECCRYHDACYDLAKREPCKEKVKTEEDMYVQTYKWNFHVADMFIECEDYGDLCKTTLCECDATLVGCFKYHLDSYNTSNVRDVTAEEFIKMLVFYNQEEERKKNEPKEE